MYLKLNVDWIRLAQDRDQKRLDVVNTVMKLQIPWKTGSEQLLAFQGLCSMELVPTCSSWSLWRGDSETGA